MNNALHPYLVFNPAKIEAVESERKLEACNLHLFQHPKEHVCDACGWVASEHRNHPSYSKLAHREDYVSDMQLRNAVGQLLSVLEGGGWGSDWKLDRANADKLDGTLELVVSNTHYVLRYVPRATVVESPAEASKPAAVAESPASNASDDDGA